MDNISLSYFFNNCALMSSKQNVDVRGSFERVYCSKELSEGLNFQKIKQVNISKNRLRGTFRGMHYQDTNSLEYKMVRCVSGKLIDYVLDVRSESETFMKWRSFELTEQDSKTLLIAPGCAHGYQTLEDNTTLLYFHTCSYDASKERLISIFSEEISIDLPLKISCISERDRGKNISSDK